jgi:uncharacterized repeat protein (TIGR01451 family)
MKKYFLCLLLASFIGQMALAQYVSIPDTNFRKFLLAQYPNAMLGNSLDTTHPSVVNATVIHCDSLFIQNLQGIQYFDNLIELNCGNNMISSLPKLPLTLQELNCKVNHLDSLPSTLPSGLKTLYCQQNHITFLPNLPSGLEILNCAYNALDTLVAYPASLHTMDCSHNLLDTLPLFNANMVSFNCSNNDIGYLPTLPTGLTFLSVSHNPLFFLPSLPNGLLTLFCSANQLNNLPTLPTSLEYLFCSANNLTNLPSLPAALKTLNCGTNNITTLPTLPSNLEILDCSGNLLSTIPNLPTTLKYLQCGYNSIPILPLLPLSLQWLDCSGNPIASLPTLPFALLTLVWNDISTQNILPTLPSGLVELNTNRNTLDSLPTLPPTLKTLIATQDSLTYLPPLPNSLTTLSFDINQLSTMPGLPNGLTTLTFSGNLIGIFNTMPLSVTALDCSGNASIACLPQLPRYMTYIRYYGTAVNCLPNFLQVSDTLRTDAAFFSASLCMPSGACVCAWNITGNVHSNISTTCALDSLNPGVPLTKLKVVMRKNGVVLDAMMVTATGEYSFDTGNSDTLEIYVDTVDKPLKVTCPTTVSHEVILTPVDSFKTNVSFGIVCSGIDAGVKSIYGRFRPTQVSHISIKSGNMAGFYNLNCSSVDPATVVTTLEGPVTFLSASTNALTPSLINGNTLTYNIPNISAVNFNNAFNIDVLTWPSAVIGNEVCITTSVLNVANDILPNNNELTSCFPVVSSYDPNAKHVSPKVSMVQGEWLNYFIEFQNTGNDTAYDVIIRDTLSKNLDWSTFTFLNASHPCEPVANYDVLSFNFIGINLLDSLRHEPESHGWLRFKVRMKDSIPFGTKTHNTAFIYFDHNPPIKTDTATFQLGPDTTYEAGPHPFDLPNALSANGDGLNESFHILNPEFINRKRIQVDKVIIFNRWGELVFQGQGTNFKWTPGYAFNANDVYTYKIFYTTNSGNEWFEQGEILLLR